MMTPPIKPMMTARTSMTSPTVRLEVFSDLQSYLFILVFSPYNADLVLALRPIGK
jgi:hypothetical protein